LLRTVAEPAIEATLRTTPPSRRAALLAQGRPGNHDIAEDKTRALRQRPTFGGLRWQWHRQTRWRRWVRPNRRQLRRGAPARFGNHLGGRLCSKAGDETCGPSGYGAGVPHAAQRQNFLENARPGRPIPSFSSPAEQIGS
jgi:hypothetical protein